MNCIVKYSNELGIRKLTATLVTMCKNMPVLVSKKVFMIIANNKNGNSQILIKL